MFAVSYSREADENDICHAMNAQERTEVEYERGLMDSDEALIDPTGGIYTGTRIWEHGNHVYGVSGQHSLQLDCKAAVRKALVPRRLAEGNIVKSNALSGDINLSKAAVGSRDASSRLGRHPFPWLQETARKLSRIESWCPREHNSNIDESEAQDMCSSIEMGIISESVTLPPELLSP